MQRSQITISESSEFLFESLRKVLHPRAVLYRGMSGLPLQNREEHLKKKKKKDPKLVKHLLKIKQTKKLKESHLKYAPYPKASFPILSVNLKFYKFKITDQICKYKMT